MKTFYQDNGIEITNVQQTNGEAPVGNGEWKEGPHDLYKYIGHKLEWFDKDMNRVHDDDLVKQGKRKDNRGRWYNKNSVSETKLVYNMDEDVGDEWTQEAPLENEPYQEFDRNKNKWTVNEKKIERAEKEKRLGQLKAEIADAEQRRIRSVLAINVDQTPTEDDIKYDQKFRNRIMELRPEVAKLEKELESA